MSERPTIHRVGPADAGKRLDVFLAERIPALSRRRIQQAVVPRVTLSWSGRARPATPVVAGGEVSIGFPPIDEAPLDIAVAVLARGPGWIAVDKPAGIPVHPVNRVRENSLVRLVRRQTGRESLRLAHRLDRETSGVLLLAEDAATARRLSLAFERRRVEKEYLAIVRGVVEADEGIVELPIGPDVRSAVHVRLAAGEGRAARTEWRVERRLRGATLLRVRPRTGRRHQIRVHLAALGHAVLGDILYGRPDRDYLDLVSGVRDVRIAEGGPRRHLLHCARIALADGGAAIDVASPLPADFRRRLEGRD